MKFILKRAGREQGKTLCGMSGCSCREADYQAEVIGLPEGRTITEYGRSRGETLAELLSSHAKEFNLDKTALDRIIDETRRDNNSDTISESLIEALTPIALERGITIEQS